MLYNQLMVNSYYNCSKGNHHQPSPNGNQEPFLMNQAIRLYHLRGNSVALPTCFRIRNYSKSLTSPVITNTSQGACLERNNCVLPGHSVVRFVHLFAPFCSTLLCYPPFVCSLCSQARSLTSSLLYGTVEIHGYVSTQKSRLIWKKRDCCDY